MISNEVWKWMLQPCVDAGCEQTVVIFDHPVLYSIDVQHGPNPEHRTSFDAVSTMKAGQSNYLLAIRDWLTRIHSPRVWESDEAL